MWSEKGEKESLFDMYKGQVVEKEVVEDKNDNV